MLRSQLSLYFAGTQAGTRKCVCDVPLGVKLAFTLVFKRQLALQLPVHTNIAVWIALGVLILPNRAKTCNIWLSRYNELILAGTFLPNASIPTSPAGAQAFLASQVHVFPACCMQAAAGRQLFCT